MDSKSSDVALLSIKPKFAEAILNGCKSVEFRRTKFARDVKFVVIYATLPVGKIVGGFEVAGIEACAPEMLWERFCTCGGIERDDFLSYYRSTRTGYAIRVKNVFRLAQARSLDRVAGMMRAPQSFSYLPSKTAERIFRYAGYKPQ